MFDVGPGSADHRLGGIDRRIDRQHVLSRCQVIEDKPAGIVSRGVDGNPAGVLPQLDVETRNRIACQRRRARDRQS